MPPKADIDTIIARRAPEIACNLRQAAAEGGTEAVLVCKADKWLSTFAEEAGIHWRPDPERRVDFRCEETDKKSARIDRLFNLVVVEFEPPNSMKPTNDASANQHAIGQVKEQIDGLVKTEGWLEDKVSGVVLDGARFIFLRRTGGRWIVEAPYEVDTRSTARFLRLLASLSREPLLPHTVQKRFAIQQQDTAVQTVRALYEAQRNPTSARAKALFQQWLDFYKDVAGLDADRLKSQKEMSKFVYDVLKTQTISSDDLERLLFALYTYGALLMKLIAVTAVTPFFSDQVSDALHDIAELDDSESDTLKGRLADIESGAWFRNLGILNLCEADFFGWYLDEWTPSIVRSVKKIIDVLHEYDPTAVEQTPERVRDLMKALYHGLLPREVRHALGEYYTPDWLAEHLLMQVDGTIWDDLDTAGAQRRRSRLTEILPRLTARRWLDPTCGSGTFLVLILNKIKSQWRLARAQTDNEGRQLLNAPSPRELLNALKQNVVGFDLNPLAVISARTNWLLSVVDLLEPGDQIEIPVYLADSVARPSANQGDLYSAGVYTLPMRGIGKEFPIPAALAQRDHLALLAAKLEESVEVPVPTDRFLADCETLFALPRAEWLKAAKSLRQLYDTLSELESRSMNGLWAGVAKNMFMPNFIGTFDYVVGNPPWVNWESLPQAYRDSTKALWKDYGLFVHTGMDVMLGKGKKDLSTLVTYVAADLYLKPGGLLGFVITQSVFKTSGAGQGFRRFRIGQDGPHLRIRAVDDFTAFQPFDGATNRTATFILQKGSPTDYRSVQYVKWKKKGAPKPGFWMDWGQAKPMLSPANWTARPVDDHDDSSAWIAAPRQALTALRRLRASTDYRAYEGVNSGGANPVYWLEVLCENDDGTVRVRMITEGAKSLVCGSHIHVIEAEHLYPLLRGRDVRRWAAQPQVGYRYLVTQDPETRIGFPEEDVRVRFPHLYAYLQCYKGQLMARKTKSVRALMQRGAFYSMFGVGPHTFAQFKVVWAELGNDLNAAVAATESGGRPIVPDHTAVLVPCETSKEAHFLASVLNSSPARLLVRSYIVLHPDPHVMKRVGIPRYDPADRIHNQLSVLSQEAHAVTAGQPGRAIDLIESEVDEAAAQLWHLSDTELSAIQQALKDS